MPNLEASFRALRVLHTARDLFKQYGFHKVGVDRIIAESKITKATFYNYFHSKERLIEMCLTFQKDGLKEEVFSIIYSYRELMVFDKLKKIFFCMPTSKGCTVYLYIFLKLKSFIQLPTRWWLIIETGW